MLLEPQPADVERPPGTHPGLACSLVCSKSVKLSSEASIFMLA